MRAHDARSGRYLTTESGKPIPHEVLAFLLSGRRAGAHVTIASRGEANRQYEAATNYLKGEHANMEQALRTTIEIELGHGEQAEHKPQGLFTQPRKAPVVRIECIHEGIADDDDNAAEWHEDAVGVATRAAGRLMQTIGLAERPAPRGTVYLTVEGDTSGLVRAITEAEQSLADTEARRRGHPTPGAVRGTPGRPFAGPTLDAPRYSDSELESIAVEVACAMFGDAYRDWLDSGDEYAVATRERGAGAIRSSQLWRDAHSEAQS